MGVTIKSITDISGNVVRTFTNADGTCRVFIWNKSGRPVSETRYDIHGNVIERHDY